MKKACLNRCLQPSNCKHKRAIIFFLPLLLFYRKNSEIYDLQVWTIFIELNLGRYWGTSIQRNAPLLPAGVNFTNIFYARNLETHVLFNVRAPNFGFLFKVRHVSGYINLIQGRPLLWGTYEVKVLNTSICIAFGEDGIQTHDLSASGRSLPP